MERIQHKFPVRNDSNGEHYHKAIDSLAQPGTKTEKTSNQLRDIRDDITIILDKDMTGFSKNKYPERTLARTKKAELSGGSNNITYLNGTQAPSSALIKIKLHPDDRFIGHEITKSNPKDDIKVTIDKPNTPPPVVYNPPPQIFLSTRSVSPAPSIIRSEVVSPPPPVASI